MSALFGHSPGKLYSIVCEEHRYGHSTGVERRTWNNLGRAQQEAAALAKRWGGLTFTVVELVPVADDIPHPSLFDAPASNIVETAPL